MKNSSLKSVFSKNSFSKNYEPFETYDHYTNLKFCDVLLANDRDQNNSTHIGSSPDYLSHLINKNANLDSIGNLDYFLRQENNRACFEINDNKPYLPSEPFDLDSTVMNTFKHLHLDEHTDETWTELSDALLDSSHSFFVSDNSKINEHLSSPFLTNTIAENIYLVDQPREPTSISVKLFVNRIPPWMTNEQLCSIFEAFGKVTKCNILTDIHGSKGCAFVRYASIANAYQAILHLHEKRVLNEKAGPVQIKYADGEIARLGLSEDVQPGGESVKLFVGCLPKFCSETTLYNLFSRFGQVDEVFLLKDENRHSKCSAFITFPRMYMAINAIRALDRRFVLSNGRRPLEVRLAQSKSSRNRCYEKNVGI